jgi:hypothetical protein
MRSTDWLQMLRMLGPVPHVRNLKVVLKGHNKDNHAYTLTTAYCVRVLDG